MRWKDSKKTEVLKAIAKGKHKFSEIKEYTGLSGDRLSKILRELKLMGLIKDMPDIGSGDMRRKLYRFTDELAVLTREEMIQLVEVELDRKLTEKERKSLLKISDFLRKVMIANLASDRKFHPENEIYNILSILSILQVIPYDRQSIKECVRYLADTGFLDLDKRLVELIFEAADITLPKKLLKDWRKTKYYKNKFEIAETTAIGAMFARGLKPFKFFRICRAS